MRRRVLGPPGSWCDRAGCGLCPEKLPGLFGQDFPVRAPLGDCWPFAARGRISLGSVPATMTAALSNAKAGKRSPAR